MFKRLPAEVVARRGDRAGKKPQPVEKAPATTVELEQAADGRMDSQSLYSVVAHNRFIEELTDKAGKRMYRALHANLHVFSSRQRKFLEKECALARKYAATAFQGIQKDGDEDEKQEQAASAVEDMMARCRAFVRERQSERGERAENGGEDEDGDGEGGVEAEAEEMKPPLLTAPVAPPPVIPPVVSKGASRSRSASPKKEKVTKSNKKKARESSSRRSRGRSDSHSRSERREKRKSRRSSGSSHRSKRRRKDSDDSSDRKRKKKRH